MVKAAPDSMVEHNMEPADPDTVVGLDWAVDPGRAADLDMKDILEVVVPRRIVVVAAPQRMVVPGCSYISLFLTYPIRNRSGQALSN